LHRHESALSRDESAANLARLVAVSINYNNKLLELRYILRLRSIFAVSSQASVSIGTITKQHRAWNLHCAALRQSRAFLTLIDTFLFLVCGLPPPQPSADAFAMLIST
jgi:hypothetical protein